jgi:hypothetical protein
MLIDNGQDVCLAKVGLENRSGLARGDVFERKSDVVIESSDEKICEVCRDFYFK